MSFKIGTVFLIFCSVALAARHSGGRILNGDPGSVRPFQLFLQAFNETADNMDYGAAVLIAPRVAVTVATLIRGFDRWTLRYGSNVFGQTSSMESFVALLHPNFIAGPQTNVNDIGVVILPSTVETIIPIALPAPEVILPRQYEEGQITNFETNVAEPSGGFTETSILRSAFLTVFPQPVCAQTFPNIAPGTFCAFDDHFSSNLCTGDRGTAFTVIFRGIETLAGITSKVSPGCDDLSTFTQIQEHIDWIRAVANI